MACRLRGGFYNWAVVFYGLCSMLYAQATAKSQKELHMSDCQDQFPLREQQAEVSNVVKLYQNFVLEGLLLLLVKKLICSDS